MADFKDYFSQYAADYANYRPEYPAALFNYLSSLTAEHKLAWDCATGNGQAAHGLIPYYEKIIATDASAQQIQEAKPHGSIEFTVMPAEKTNFTDQSVDLITVAQALHWFDLPAFYAEVNRVLKPTGILAAWCYTLLEIEDAMLTKAINSLYCDITAPYWAKERRWIDEEYKTIPFPLQQLKAPQFVMEQHWNLKQLIGYLNTWSGVKNYINENGHNPIEIIYPLLEKAWGDIEQVRLIRWPLSILIGLPAAGNSVISKV